MSKQTVRLDASVPKYVKDALFLMARIEGMSASMFLSILVTQEMLYRLKHDCRFDPVNTEIPF